MRREEGQKVVLYSQVDFKLFVCDLLIPLLAG